MKNHVVLSVEMSEDEATMFFDQCLKCGLTVTELMRELLLEGFTK
jgi:hypothetical protein